MCCGHQKSYLSSFKKTDLKLICSGSPTALDTVKHLSLWQWPAAALYKLTYLFFVIIVIIIIILLLILLKRKPDHEEYLYQLTLEYHYS